MAYFIVKKKRERESVALFAAGDANVGCSDTVGVLQERPSSKQIFCFYYN
jgi:hypothetical protein